MTYVINPLETSPVQAQPEQVTLPRWFNRSSLAGGLLFMSGLVVGIETTHVDANQIVPESAAGLAFDLNERDHTAEAANVKVGYEVPLSSSPVEGAVAIYNPLYFGDNTYGYVTFNAQNGEVTVSTVQYDGPLQPARLGDHDAVVAYDAVSPIALVYNEYTRLDNGDPARNYMAVMGSQSGELPRDLTPEQFNEVSDASVGALVYAGK